MSIASPKDKNSLIFFKNYDYGTGPDEKMGPGKGLYENMDKYKSVSDFLKKKRRKNKNRKKMALLLAIVAADSVKGKVYKKDKNDLQDPYENQTTPIPYNPAEVSMVGLYDGILSDNADLEGKPNANLYYGVLETHDYAAEDGKTDEKDDE